jgi:ferritin-like metal-binding protein YciE
MQRTFYLRLTKKGVYMSKHDKHSEQVETIQHYVSDMLAVEKEILEAVKRQADDDHVQDHNANAKGVIQRIERVAKQHTEQLDRHLEAMGGDPASGIKKVVTASMGAVAGMYDKMRSESVSKMLRDDYTALNLAAVSYTMLHTTGLALQDQRTADLALRHLRDYTPIIMDINEIIPQIVVEDLREDVEMVDASSADRATMNTQQAWQPSNGQNRQNASTLSSGFSA